MLLGVISRGNEIAGLSTFKYPAVKWDVPMCILCFGIAGR